MTQSGSDKLDPDLEGVELLFHQKGGWASFGIKIALSLNGVDPKKKQSAQISYMILGKRWSNLLCCRNIIVSRVLKWDNLVLGPQTFIVR
jgi:hypothetical protein